MTQPWWDKEAFAAKRPYLEARAAMTTALRGYFTAKEFLEVETPALQVSPGLEPHLKAFKTQLTDPYGGAPKQMFLHTSPEFAMKKLLAAGLPRIFQIAPTYRDGERSDTHHPAFAMLEWYRAGESLSALIDDCGAILRATWQAAPEELRKGGLRWNGKACDPMRRPEVLTVAEAFRRHCAGLDILGTAPDPLKPDAQRLRDAATHAGLKVPESEDWEDIFFHLFLEYIEPKLGVGAPTALVDYPLSMAALAKKSARDPRVADRVELYVAGLELANGFAELTDAAEQRRRFAADMDKKERLYGERYPIDEDFLAALEQMPEASGIALGFDRLVMLATGAAKIDDVLWAPVA